MSVKLGIAPIAWSNDDMPELVETPLLKHVCQKQDGLVLLELNLVENFQKHQKN